MNPSHHFTGKLGELYRALLIKRSLGTYTAARYLRKRKWSIEAAILTLARHP